MKKFDKQKQKATPEAGRHLKQMDFEKPHPLFLVDDESNYDAISEIKNYKPSQSYLELSTKKEGNGEKQVKVLGLIERMKKLKTKVVHSSNKKAEEQEEIKNWRKVQK